MYIVILIGVGRKWWGSKSPCQTKERYAQVVSDDGDRIINDSDNVIVMTMRIGVTNFWVNDYAYPSSEVDKPGVWRWWHWYLNMIFVGIIDHLATPIMRVEMTTGKSDLFRGRQSRGTPKCSSTQVIVPGSLFGCLIWGEHHFKQLFSECPPKLLAFPHDFVSSFSALDMIRRQSNDCVDFVCLVIPNMARRLRILICDLLSFGHNGLMDDSWPRVSMNCQSCSVPNLPFSSTIPPRSRYVCQGE